MKKCCKVLLLFMCIITLLIACSQKKSKNLTITLEENATTGYMWSYEIKNPDIAKLVKDESIAGDTDKSGAPGEHVFEFSGSKKGETTIVFTYKQDWDGGGTGEVKEITVIVDEHGSITEK